VNARLAAFEDHLNLVVKLIARHPEGISVARLADSLGLRKDTLKFQINHLRCDGRIDYHPTKFERRPKGPPARVLVLTETAR
jgi:predicted ArsR family transcriptional regulator